MSYLRKPVHQTPKFIVASVGTMVVVAFLGSILRGILGLQSGQKNSISQVMKIANKIGELKAVEVVLLLAVLGVVLFILAAIEEAIFRLPLALFVRFGEPVVIPCILLSSLLFGYVHDGEGSVLVQGAAGVVLCVVFLRASDFGRRKWRGFVIATTVHAAFNLLLFSVPIIGIASMS